MRISIIAALGHNREIGQEGKIPWQLPEDMKAFRKLTEGHTVIMGRKTFESIGHPLKLRTNIVLSSSLEQAPGILIARSWDEAINLIPDSESNAFIIGGNKVYEAGLSASNRMYLTFVDGIFPQADSFFPQYSPREWTLKTSELHLKSGHPEQSHDYIVRIFDKK